MIKPSTKKATKAIEQAFAEVPYPGDENIAYHQDYHPSDGWDCAQTFKGKLRRDVKPDMLRGCYYGISCFTPEAWHYYLPAYMLGKLHYGDIIDFAGDSIVYHLMPPKEANLLNWWDMRIKLLSKEQKIAVRMFLEIAANDPMGDANAAQNALDSYWSKSI